MSSLHVADVIVEGSHLFHLTSLHVADVIVTFVSNPLAGPVCHLSDLHDEVMAKKSHASKTAKKHK